MSPETLLGIIAFATVTTATIGATSVGIMLYVLGTNRGAK